MDISAYDYELPDELIAKYPNAERSASRLLMLSGNGTIEHGQFIDLVGRVSSNDLLVFNDTKVIPARILGHKVSGAKVEVLVERILDERECLAHVKVNRALKSSAEILVGETGRIQVLGREENLYRLAVSEPWLDFLAQYGHVPLPPYLNRQDEAEDQQRYQTVYAKNPGAVAAPTAGLHFDDAILQDLADKGVDTGFVTLHVGAGTFQPIRGDDASQHKMHNERYRVSEELVQKVAACKARGGRVIAVGTTTVRTLEAATRDGSLHAESGDTEIFIYPGYLFKTVDALLTNFHLPKSTLLLLVSAMAGRDNILRAYREAVAESYRFFSYGDAMFIDPGEWLNSERLIGLEGVIPSAKPQEDRGV